ncbi:hypothetical protein CPU12_07500 [Malaciobacter molluscorum LMG 25693]|uniref:Membrane protein n=1 Tax=Malaciobacter molluscorum LMG 25693 TaxID=870501 RepID=A0A2G1DI54_9BACT|nr:hypothetical protein [Malaciobacter molluscorum]AXX93047.1 putative membrane protein [Malaciobacter molluscorum LMG 25693]PHO18104.1 hypothetical protein CPU12_07500 [Malaciobacter molluscorum LMG 25693]RXJ94787.1 hypothetical protein CRV00_05505 [Malaciobacter molluscorum]
MPLIKCPECEHEILSRIGTICPKCGHMVGYFEGDKTRKKYGKFFAISLIIPFFSFVLIILASYTKTLLISASIIYVILAFISSPIRYRDIFFTNFEKIFFWGIWITANALLITMIYNLMSNYVR